MNLQELIYKLTEGDDSPLSKEQKAELTDEYFKEMGSLNGKIRDLKTENNAQKERIGNLEEYFNSIKKDSIACLTSVKAMLEMTINSGATHGERDFYSRAMLKYMEEVIGRIDKEKCDDALPF